MNPVIIALMFGSSAPLVGCFCIGGLTKEPVKAICLKLGLSAGVRGELGRGQRSARICWSCWLAVGLREGRKFSQAYMELCKPSTCAHNTNKSILMCSAVLSEQLRRFSHNLSWQRVWTCYHFLLMIAFDVIKWVHQWNVYFVVLLSCLGKCRADESLD